VFAQLAEAFTSPHALVEAGPWQVDVEDLLDPARPVRHDDHRSASVRASSIEWVMKNTVWPVWAMIFSNSACIASRVMASTAPNGSSINRISGSDTNALAIPTR